MAANKISDSKISWIFEPVHKFQQTSFPLATVESM